MTPWISKTQVSKKLSVLSVSHPVTFLYTNFYLDLRFFLVKVIVIFIISKSLYVFREIPMHIIRCLIQKFVLFIRKVSGLYNLKKGAIFHFMIPKYIFYTSCLFVYFSILNS